MVAISVHTEPNFGPFRSLEPLGASQTIGVYIGIYKGLGYIYICMIHIGVVEGVI